MRKTMLKASASGNLPGQSSTSGEPVKEKDVSEAAEESSVPQVRGCLCEMFELLEYFVLCN
jgi:hypothetical protein